MIRKLLLPLLLFSYATEVTTGGDYSVPVNLTVQPPLFTVTLPTEFPVTVTPTGEILTADDITIQNNSTDVYCEVSNITFESDDWELVSCSDSCEDNQIAFKVNGHDLTDAWKSSYIDPASSMPISYQTSLPTNLFEGTSQIGNIVVTVSPLISSPSSWFNIDDKGVLISLTEKGFAEVGTHLIIPNGVTALEISSLGCPYVWSGTLEQKPAYQQEALKRITHMVIPGTCKEMRSGCIAGNPNLTSVVINEGVEVIDIYAFSQASGLTEVTLPSTITSIHREAFGQNTSLQAINIKKPKDSISGAPWGAAGITVNWLD